MAPQNLPYIEPPQVSFERPGLGRQTSSLNDTFVVASCLTAFGMSKRKSAIRLFDDMVRHMGA